MEERNICEVRIQRVFNRNDSPIKALVSVSWHGVILKGILVVEHHGELFVQYPWLENHGLSEKQSAFHPTKQTAETLYDAIIDAYHDKVKMLDRTNDIAA